MIEKAIYRIGVNALVINVGEPMLAEIHGGELELHPLRQELVAGTSSSEQLRVGETPSG